MYILDLMSHFNSANYTIINLYQFIDNYKKITYYM